jgi:hypothetical protein
MLLEYNIDNYCKKVDDIFSPDAKDYIELKFVFNSDDTELTFLAENNGMGSLKFNMTYSILRGGLVQKELTTEEQDESSSGETPGGSTQEGQDGSLLKEISENEIIYEDGIPVDFGIYNRISAIERKETFKYRWEYKTIDENGNVSETPILMEAGSSSIKYSQLKEDDLWIADVSKTQGELSYMENSGNVSARFIPKDDMTARDVYLYMHNNPNEYTYPKIKREVDYIVSYDNESSKVADRENPKYINQIYNTVSYSIEPSGPNSYKIVSNYKSPHDIYIDLYGNPDSQNTNEDQNVKKYDSIPNIIKETTQVSDDSQTIHNFNDLVSSDIIIRNIDTDNRKVTLLIFLAFKTEIVILKTDYYYANPSLNEYPTISNFIDESGAGEDDHLTINIASEDPKAGSLDAITIKNINPADITSLPYRNLSAIKVYKNMLYVIDNTLDMVLRYDIDYLINPEEKLDNAFTVNSIELVDSMQGSGDATDKIYFNRPYSIEVSDDYVYIVDRGNNCIKQYTHSLNFVKTLKNGHFTRFDVQAAAVNPYVTKIGELTINPNSLWIAYTSTNKLHLSILDNGMEVYNTQIENISILKDDYTWDEEIRSICFTKNNSNYFYITTTKRVYKFHSSNPSYPFASLSYFKQRSIIATTKWSAMHYQWHAVSSLESSAVNGSSENLIQDVTWDYEPPMSSAEVLDNKSFCLTGCPEIEGDIIFHFGILYNNSKIREYIKKMNAGKMSDERISFKDIPHGILSSMIKSVAILLYTEPDSFISSITNPEMKINDIYELNEMIENDYINTLTFNKILHSLNVNLYKIKNSLLGHFRAATNLDNVIVYDNVIMDDYFNNLQFGENDNYYVHDNEQVSIIINRVLENIYDIQEKIIDKMQTEFMAAQSYVNNTSRLI